ncbi:hypothetical protein OG730_41610 (plasmid) [Streptomyces sp. NBC_01298]|uniref:hypothetical protein n=1 Tax=Streptomyces sp. NBC_01298 TaxID=2903817 RepID=UPI002E150E43|nr:hypothetical protein OG730_41610 [Streptomyces sp. NBC_01298]
MTRNTIDLTELPHVSEIDRTYLPCLEEELIADRQVVIGDIGRFRSGFEYYAPIAPDETGRPNGGMLSLSEVQVRHIHARLGQQIAAWDDEDAAGLCPDSDCDGYLLNDRCTAPNCPTEIDILSTRTTTSRR